jgi:hypothetical protein
LFDDDRVGHRWCLMRKLFLAVCAAVLVGPAVFVVAPAAHDADGLAVQLAARAVSLNSSPAPILVKEFPAHAPLSGSPSPVLVKEFPAHAPATGRPSPVSTDPSSAGSPPPATQSGPFHLVWSTNFPVSAPLGSFGGGGNGSSVHAPDLPSALQGQWGAYPSGWADTATQRGLPVGGYYDPGTTIWISGGQMHIKLWRGASGSVHSAALVPLAAQGRTYGRYVETFRVPEIATGYKSAHLLWPSNGDQDTSSFEVDYPENEWDTGISAYVHAGNDPQQAFPAGADWAGWHTSEIDWTPNSLSFRLDGKLIGSTTSGVPDEPMDWIIQNESALNGESAAPNSSAQMDISYVAYYRYTG